MRMSPKLKENVEITWRVVALGLLSVCVYFLVKINDKVDYSYKANVEQAVTNQSVSGRIITLEAQVDRLGVTVADLRERQYKLELRTRQ